jgi:hypothetical protein
LLVDELSRIHVSALALVVTVDGAAQLPDASTVQP